MENQNQNTVSKTNMEKICNTLGLEMYQLFDAWTEPGGTYLKDSPYFFTERGVCRGNGKPAQGVLEALAAGKVGIEPLGYYKYRHMGRIDLEKLRGQKVRAEIASDKSKEAHKTLYAVSTIGGQGTTWEVEFDDMYETGSRQFAGLAEAVEFYNGKELVQDE